MEDGGTYMHTYMHTWCYMVSRLQYNSSVCSREHLAIDMTIHSSKNGGKISIFSIDSRVQNYLFG